MQLKSVGLAGPVRSDQAADLAPGDLEGDILERGHAAEPDGEPADRKQRRGKQVYAFVRASGFRLGQLHGFSAPGIVRPVKAAVDRSLDVSRSLVTCFVIRTLVDDERSERSFSAGEKIERCGLERAVADREIVIAAGNFERRSPRQHGGELVGIARDGVALADRDQRRLVDTSQSRSV